MQTEYELRILEINIQEIEEKLKNLGATFTEEYFYKRRVYNMVPVKKDEWIRLRTDGTKTTITYKKIINETSIDGTKELEVEVDDFEKANELLYVMGYKSNAYQENKRKRYMLNNVEIDIDSWPQIPPYLEIEGKSEAEVMEVIKLLNIKTENITYLNCESIYKEIYKIDVDEIEELKFKE